MQLVSLPRPPNNPTLCIPGSAVQMLLYLWQLWGQDHSLGSLGSAQHPLGVLVPVNQPKFPLT